MFITFVLVVFSLSITFSFTSEMNFYSGDRTQLLTSNHRGSHTNSPHWRGLFGPTDAF